MKLHTAIELQTEMDGLSLGCPGVLSSIPLQRNVHLDQRQSSPVQPMFRETRGSFKRKAVPDVSMYDKLGMNVATLKLGPINPQFASSLDICQRTLDKAKAAPAGARRQVIKGSADAKVESVCFNFFIKW